MIYNHTVQQQLLMVDNFSFGPIVDYRVDTCLFYYCSVDDLMSIWIMC